MFVVFSAKFEAGVAYDLKNLSLVIKALVNSKFNSRATKSYSTPPVD